MLRFLARRLLAIVPVLLAVITITFFLVRLAPGGPFSEEKNFPAESIRRLNEHYGLDDPLLLQYMHYLGNVAVGDLGPSFRYPNRTVNGIIADTPRRGRRNARG